jgi:hypothetical protein
MLWYLFDLDREKSYESLTLEDCKVLLQESTLADAEKWIYWTELQSDWKSLKEAPPLRRLLADSSEKAVRVSPPPPPLPNFNPRKVETNTNSRPSFDNVISFKPQKITNKPVANDLQLTEVTPDLQKEARHKDRLRVIVVFENSTFLTYTQTISPTGMHLSHDLPISFVKGSQEVDVFVKSSRDGECLRLRCVLSEENGAPRHLSIQAPDSKRRDQWQKWVNLLSEKKDLTTRHDFLQVA